MGFHFKLTHKIAAIGTAGVLGLVTVGGFYLAGVTLQATYQKSAEEAAETATLTKAVLIDMLQARRAEKDFALRNEETYVARQSARVKAATQKLEQLRNSLSAMAQKKALDQVDAIRAGFDVYAREFAKFADTKRTLGLNQNSGLEGALRASVHKIEGRLKELDEPRLNAAMLTMRRHEKDFMLRHDPKYGEEMKKAASAFSELVAGAAIPDGTKNDINESLSAYQRDFSAWMNGWQAVAQAQRAMSESYARIEPVIESVYQEIDGLESQASAANQATQAATRRSIEITVLVVAVAVALFGFFIGRSVSHPLNAMTATMRELADGKLDVVIPGAGRRDEIGAMAQAVEIFKGSAVERLRLETEQKEAEGRAAAVRKAELRRLADGFQAAVGVIMDTVSSSATELEAAAGTLTKTADMTQQLSGAVAAASQQASTNVQSVASATDEMSSSVNEISRQVQESSRIAGEAVEQAERTNARINELSHAASRIGDVVKLITAIAEQTNLLALNATIEAARAGEAGRGFAVVAQEVKALAAQTAKATDEIGQQIASMQTATGVSVSAMKEIGGTITRISEIAAAISAAVEEQGAATQDIARNVQQAARGTTEVAENIVELNKEAGETGSASTQVLSSAQSLSHDSNKLKLEVDKFLATVRAA